MFKAIALDPRGCRRLYATGDSPESARAGVLEILDDYLLRRPDLEPIGAWTVEVMEVEG